MTFHPGVGAISAVDSLLELASGSGGGADAPAICTRDPVAAAADALGGVADITNRLEAAAWRGAGGGWVGADAPAIGAGHFVAAAADALGGVTHITNRLEAAAGRWTLLHTLVGLALKGVTAADAGPHVAVVPLLDDEGRTAALATLDPHSAGQRVVAFEAWVAGHIALGADTDASAGQRSKRSQAHGHQGYT